MNEAEKISFLIYKDISEAMNLLNSAKKRMDFFYQHYLSDVKDKGFPCMEYFFEVELKDKKKD